MTEPRVTGVAEGAARTTRSLTFIGLVVVAVFAQIKADAFRPFLYWFVVVATTTAGPILPIARSESAIRAVHPSCSCFSWRRWRSRIVYKEAAEPTMKMPPKPVDVTFRVFNPTQRI